jgi:anti-sigma regulatory factor (Ser/Thr protein kinase)
MDGGKRVVTSVVSGVAFAAEGGTSTVNEAAFSSGCSPLSSIAPVLVPPSQLRGMGMGDDWPLQSYLELGALPSAVPCARAHAKQLLWEWGLTELTESVELLVTELTTNAMRASQSFDPIQPIRFWLLSDKVRVLIMVWDGSPQQPMRMDVDEEAESGRGLLLVEAMSDRWGSYIPKLWGGKVVWCEVSGDASAAESQ